MGNQHSNDGEGRHSRPFSRSGGALGLSKSELEKRCQPSGLYDSCQWEDKAIRKLVGDGRIAARLKGSEGRSGESDQECPICFLYYSQVNVTKCCNAYLCSECYLQVRPQKEKHPSCPFCNHTKLSISVAKKLSSDQVQERDQEEKRVEEAIIRARKDSLDATEADKDNNPSGSFGSSLEQDSRVALMRARSESFNSNEENHLPNQSNLLQSLAMTPEERRRLEDEMKAQHAHPLALRVEAEAAERRMENDRAYYRSQSGTLRELRSQRAAELFRHQSSRGSRRRGQSGRDWNQIVDAFERGGNGEVQSLDDLVVLEAAILLSMEEDARRSRNGEESNDFDAARHARDGFPLVRSFLANREGSASGENVQRLARSLNSSRRRNQVLRTGHGSTRGMPDTALDTAAMLMRGVSEEDQIAMAIAASLQEQNSGGEGEGGNNESGAGESSGDVEPSTESEDSSIAEEQTDSAGIVSGEAAVSVDENTVDETEVVSEVPEDTGDDVDEAPEEDITPAPASTPETEIMSEIAIETEGNVADGDGSDGVDEEADGVNGTQNEEH